MKRHPSLHPLSEHHHHALVQALQIRRLQGQAPTAWRRAAKLFLQFWRRAGQKHFREEEEILLPAYARHVPLTLDLPVVRMLAEHAAIRAAVADLEAALAAGQAVETHLTALGQLLHDHVRLEENEVFPRIEAALGPNGLGALGGRLSRLYGARPARRQRKKSTSRRRKR